MQYIAFRDESATLFVQLLATQATNMTSLSPQIQRYAVAQLWAHVGTVFELVRHLMHCAFEVLRAEGGTPVHHAANCGFLHVLEWL
jgi:hypothetical protein